MTGVIMLGGVGLLVSFVLYCCVRVGAMSDRQMEELEKRKADGKAGKTEICEG